jgi:hypothetical protein
MRHLRKLNGRRQLLYGMAVLATCALSAAGGALAAGSSGSSAPFQPPAGASGELATAPDAASVAALEIMRRPRTSADDISSHAIGSLSSASGANIALARRAHGFRNGEAWVIPGIGNECLWAESTTAKNGGAVCGGDSTATSGGLMLEADTPSAPGNVFIAGIVPDGIAAVTVDLVDGGTVKLPVYENVYMQEIAGAPKSVTVRASQVLAAAMATR